MSEPLVSVVVTTYNRCGLLEEAVASVLGQAGCDVEAIVVDDGSEDATQALLNELSDPRLTPLRIEPNGGRPEAANLGLTKVRGAFVLFLDDDDRLRPDALMTLSTLLTASPTAVGAVGARWKFGVEVWAGGVRIPHPRKARVRDVWPELVAGWSFVPGQALLRTELVRAVGGFRGGFSPADDRDLWLRLADYGPFALSAATTLDYRSHPGQSRPADIERRRQAVWDAAIARRPANRRDARLIRRAGSLWFGADRARRSGRNVEALVGYTGAVALAPRLGSSPVTRPLIAHDVIRAVRRGLLHRGTPDPSDGQVG